MTLRHGDNLRLCTALGAVAWLAASDNGVAQTAGPVGVAKPAEYECDGLKGVALGNCKDLNAASANSAATPRVVSPANATHDAQT